MSEKTEKATPYKLQKAREKGQVSKSTELNTSFLLIIFLGIISISWLSALQEIKKLLIHLLNLAGHLSLSVDNLSQLSQFIWPTITSLWLPFALTGIIAVILTTIMQTGFVWSAVPLKPDFKRLNLVQGFKRLFSSRLIFETAKNSLKLSLTFLLLLLSFHHETKILLQLLSATPVEQPTLIMHLLLKIMLQLLLLLLTLAIIDRLYTRWKYQKDNRMSKQEVKDEYRQREGDPKIKAKIKQLQQNLRQKTASLEQIKTADVIITNPTHLAIALKYERTTMPAPKVVCKAQGELVKRAKWLARRYCVPMIENKPFAQSLFATVELNQWIHREHFPVAAAIFREVYHQRSAV
ncbi:MULTISPECIES: flagellar biosynthesis protein FlhB [unclassified Legionella]|uniref:EscU/YscU/HrcU family type III secretion system export apparatus switch protein n=1 Tax=unclassified Legionella TaxID=2622702 RepID=UPI001054F498|nr:MULTISPECIES: EscU/YscU/HrcU family type III secretion system export apparatus switch protein [unclassified Legionella]MDI9817566.1 EscU/YscU/HrcU family type III secretion system export apparatus switch protein [Legionella sp. PL877]